MNYFLFVKVIQSSRRELVYSEYYWSRYIILTACIWMSLSQELEFFKWLTAILSSSFNSTLETTILSSVSRVFIILVFALSLRFFTSAFLANTPSPRYKSETNPVLTSGFFTLIWNTLAVLAGIKAASCLVHVIAMPCHFTSPCTSYRISIGALSFKKSFRKISTWGIAKLSGTTSILSGYPMSEIWTEPSDSKKLSITLTICNFSFLRVCVSRCILHFIRLGSAPVSNTKRRSGFNPW